MKDHMRLVALAGGVAVALTALAAAHAQPPPLAPTDKDFFVSADGMANRTADTVYGAGPTYTYMTITRQPGIKYDVEVHDNRNDVLLIQEGRGTAQLGGVVTGNHLIGPNEHRGGTVTGAHTQVLAPGDLLFIPAGMPHVLTPASDSPRLRYLAVKTQP